MRVAVTLPRNGELKVTPGWSYRTAEQGVRGAPQAGVTRVEVAGSDAKEGGLETRREADIVQKQYSNS